MKEKFPTKKDIPTLEKWHEIVSIIQNTPDNDVIELRLRVSPDDPNLTTLEQLLENLEQIRKKYRKREAFISITSSEGKINNIDPDTQNGDTPIKQEEIIHITIDYVLPNVDALYEERQEAKQESEDAIKWLQEKGESLELNPDLPKELKKLDKWPEGVEDYNMLGAFFIYQLGDMSCYARLGPDPKDPKGQDLEVQMIWVDPEYREKGLGIQMLKLLRKKFPKLTMTPTTSEGLALADKLDRELG